MELLNVMEIKLLNLIGTTTEVHLYKVESQLLEEEICILLVMLIESHSLAYHIAIEHAATGVTACIAIYACLQALAVDMVNDALQTVRETCRVYQQLTCLLIPASKIAVVNIYVVEANALQSL